MPLSLQSQVREAVSQTSVCLERSRCSANLDLGMTDVYLSFVEEGEEPRN